MQMIATVDAHDDQQARNGGHQLDYDIFAMTSLQA